VQEVLIPQDRRLLPHQGEVLLQVVVKKHLVAFVNVKEVLGGLAQLDQGVMTQGLLDRWVEGAGFYLLEPFRLFFWFFKAKFFFLGQKRGENHYSLT